jgi:hypothetical protein
MLAFFFITLKEKEVSESLIFPKADLVITEVKNVVGGDYSITVQNKGNIDVTNLFYICMWDDVYIAKGKSGCNNGGVVNYDLQTQMPTPLKAGSSQTITFEGIYGLPSHENLYFAVDKSNDPKTTNLIDESDENNNQYTYIK